MAQGPTVRVAMTAFPPDPPSRPSCRPRAGWRGRSASSRTAGARYGDVFSVMFQGFRTPLVMVSRPDVIRALYGERGHTLPPGRTVR